MSSRRRRCLKLATRAESGVALGRSERMGSLNKVCVSMKLANRGQFWGILQIICQCRTGTLVTKFHA